MADATNTEGMEVSQPEPVKTFAAPAEKPMQTQAEGAQIPPGDNLDKLKEKAFLGRNEKPAGLKDILDSTKNMQVESVGNTMPDQVDVKVPPVIPGNNQK